MIIDLFIEQTVINSIINSIICNSIIKPINRIISTNSSVGFSVFHDLDPSWHRPKPASSRLGTEQFGGGFESSDPAPTRTVPWSNHARDPGKTRHHTSIMKSSRLSLHKRQTRSPGVTSSETDILPPNLPTGFLNTCYTFVRQTDIDGGILAAWKAKWSPISPDPPPVTVSRMGIINSGVQNQTTHACNTDHSL